MSTTSIDAYNEVMGLVKVAIETACNRVLGYTPDIRWPYTSQPDKPTNTGNVWCDVYYYINNERQSALSTQEGEAGQRVFDASGIVGIIFYVPISIRDVPKIYLPIASAVRNAFRTDSSTSVWYRNSRISDGLTPENNFYRFSVVSEFNFSEIV